MCARTLLLSLALTVIPAVAGAQTTTRFEQDNPLITYTGTWYPNSNPLESGGSATLANLKGSQAIVVFNGTGITWIGESDEYSGICYLTLDGVPTQVDTATAANNNGGSTQYQVPQFSATGLAPGLHRLTIDIIHGHDETSDQSWIWVDAFDIQNGTLVANPVPATTGTYDQGTVSANYQGHWFQNTGTQYSGGAIDSATDANAEVDFTFNGTSVSWLGYQDPYSGIARVLIDGNLQATIDTYSATAEYKTVTWTTSGLSAGTHTLSIVATGTADAASGGAWVWVDGFQVGGSVSSGPPQLNSGGIVSAASFQPAPNNQIAPGQIISIFGQNLSPAAVSATGIPLPTQLGTGNVSVTACGQTIPLYGVYPNQINAELPVGCAAGSGTATVSVGGTTMSQPFTVAPAAPAIFSIAGSGSGDGVIVHADNSLVTAASPASAGETVVIYATGLGATSPSFPTGSAANQTNTTVLPVAVTIGGQPAAVQYSGLTQGLVGLYQVNAVVPQGLTGSQPVAITVGSQYNSPAGITISIQ